MRGFQGLGAGATALAVVPVHGVDPDVGQDGIADVVFVGRCFDRRRGGRRRGVGIRLAGLAGRLHDRQGETAGEP